MSYSRVLSVAKDVEDTKDNKFEESITEREGDESCIDQPAHCIVRLSQ